MLSGKDENDEQISETGSSEGIIKNTIKFNRPVSMYKGKIIIRCRNTF
jgi:hypothetical protein